MRVHFVYKANGQIKKNKTAMRISKLILYALACVILLSSVGACSAEKEVTERKNLMMPKKSEMPRNKRYKEAEKRKVNKNKVSKSRNKSLF
jgi:hypothetical protein